MNKRELGATGIKVSEVAFGGVEIGMPYGIGVNGPQDMLNEAEAVSLLHRALDSGVNFFDTARMYGRSEDIMGRAFADRRDKAVIATKCVHLLNPDGTLPSGKELRKKIEGSLAESLQALRTDYVDVFMLHQADLRILSCDDVLDSFLVLKNKGLFRACGVSTYKLEETEFVLDSGLWDVMQIPFNMMDQRQGTYFEKAREKQLGIIVRSVLLKGLLSGRGTNLHPALKEVEEHIRNYNELLHLSGYTLPELATKFALSYPEVAAVLVGIDRPQYLDEALRTADGNYLEPDVLRRAAELAYPDADFLDLPHWDRMGWLK